MINAFMIKLDLFPHCFVSLSVVCLLRMREVTVGEQKVLLVRTHGQYSAVGSRCSHYNAPLIKGKLSSLYINIWCITQLNVFAFALSEVNPLSSDDAGTLVGDRVRCPFHGACFNVRTGDIEEYPGLDCLPSYKVKHGCRDQPPITFIDLMTETYDLL